MIDKLNMLSLLMKDQPMPPKKTVVYWIEYIIRHKGGAHIKSPVINMKWLVI